MNTDGSGNSGTHNTRQHPSKGKLYNRREKITKNIIGNRHPQEIKEPPLGNHIIDHNNDDSPNNNRSSPIPPHKPPHHTSRNTPNASISDESMNDMMTVTEPYQHP